MAQIVEKSGAIPLAATESVPLNGHVFEPATGELRSPDGDVVALRSRTAAVLACLAKSPGQAISRDTLISRLTARYDVTEDSIAQCIDDIRRALGDRDGKIVQVLPGVGYRLNTAQPTMTLGRLAGLLVIAAALLATAISLWLTRS